MESMAFMGCMVCTISCAVTVIIGAFGIRIDIDGNAMASVKLYANLRDLAGASQLEVSSSTVRGVLEELMKLAPSLRSAIEGHGELASQLVLALNGRTVTDLDAPVGPEDVLAVFPPIAGG